MTWTGALDRIQAEAIPHVMTWTGALDRIQAEAIPHAPVCCCTAACSAARILRLRHDGQGRWTGFRPRPSLTHRCAVAYCALFFDRGSVSGLGICYWLGSLGGE